MRALRIAVALAVAATVLAAWRCGILAQLRHPAEARAAIAALGPWGHAAFVLAYAILQPFGVPGTVFILAAPLLWPWPVAFAVSLAGTMAASVVGFAFARFIARDFVAARIPARMRRYDEALARRAFATVLALRLVFWMPPWLHFFFGVSRVSFATHFWASLLGYLPSLLATAYFGDRLFVWLGRAPTSVWAGLALALAALGAVAWAIARRRGQSPVDEPR